jgi:hypothetical protein
MFQSLRQRSRDLRMHEAALLSGHTGVGLQDYDMVAGSARPPRMDLAVVLGGTAAVVAGLWLTTGVVVAGGGLPALAVYALYIALKQPRGLLISDDGVMLFGVGFWTLRPKAVLSGPVQTSTLTHPVEDRFGSVRIAVGDQLVWVNPKTLRRMASRQGEHQ